MGDEDSRLTDEARSAFLDQFRAARARAIADAEGFQEVIFVLERFGTMLSKRIGTLGTYKDCIQSFAERSPLSRTVPDTRRVFHTPFGDLYDIIRNARNDALHQGSYARHLTNHAIELCLIMEDALSQSGNRLSDFMVRNVLCAELWQPISYIRQIMLTNNFSFMPVMHEGWKLVPDREVAKLLGPLQSEDRRDFDKRRKEALAMTLEETLMKAPSILVKAETTEADGTVDALLVSDKFARGPVLVLKEGKLVGILTSFDLM
jgi:CBS domain-containing protein